MKKLFSALKIATLFTLLLNLSPLNINRAIAQDTQEIENWIRLCNWTNGESALEACDQLIEVDPNYHKAKIEKALTLLALEKYDQAEAYFREILDQPIDLRLLTKSFNNFFNSKSYQTEAELEIISTTEDPNNPETLPTYLRVKTIAKIPNQIWSEITLLTLDADYQPKITLISDGQKVWKIAHNSQQYAVSDLNKFSEGLDSLLLFSSQIYLLFWQGFYSEGQIPDNISQEEIGKSMEIGITKMALEMLLLAPDHLRGYFQGSDYIYEYLDPQKGLTFTIRVDPETANIKQIQLKGQEQQLNMVIKETIQKRVANPSLEADQFRFFPHSDLKQVEDISIWDLFMSQ